jgi:hypothetical protein
MDGKPSAMPLPHGAIFPRSNCLSDAKIDRQVNLFGGGEEKGWIPGIATGDDFTKRYNRAKVTRNLCSPLRQKEK